MASRDLVGVGAADGSYAPHDLSSPRIELPVIRHLVGSGVGVPDGAQPVGGW